MKSAQQITPTCAYHRKLQEYDLREIDCPRLREVFRLKYLARLSRIVNTAQRLAGPAGRVLEIGCSQANAGLLLAEAGLTVVPLDLRPEALSYAQAKHERGIFLPVAGSAQALPFADGQFDCVLLAELLEHCARPQEIVAEARRCVKPGGYLIVTTPNGEYFRSQESLYDPVSAAAEQSLARQFGPEGADHLFAFTGKTLAGLLSSCRLQVLRCGYMGSILLSDHLRTLKRLLPPGAILLLSSLVNRLPVLRRCLSFSLFAVAQKTGP